MGLFWIWDENIPDSTPVFPLLQSSAYLNKKGCPASHTALPGRRLGVPGKLGGGTARTAGSDWPEGCPMPQGTILSNKFGVASWGWALLRFQLGISQWVVSRCIVHH